MKLGIYFHLYHCMSNWPRITAQHVWKCENIMAIYSAPSQDQQNLAKLRSIHQWPYQR